MEGIILFNSTRQAMAQEALLLAKGINVRIIPTPEKIRATCGFALKYALENEEEILTYLIPAEVDSRYHVKRQGLKINYSKVG